MWKWQARELESHHFNDHVKDNFSNNIYGRKPFSDLVQTE